ncbi:MAG: conjugal transfer protein TraD [Sphingomonas sp.]|uniref:conjugal transfer protein TraD n=1 Tax=Sphingomonas sp. TaxID=28214 RepID=UPI003F3BAD2A
MPLIDCSDIWFVLHTQAEDYVMRKPRDFDAELKALNSKAKLLRDRKLVQLGELVVATGADTLPIETLAGALLAAVKANDRATQEAWRKSGAAFFQRTPRSAAINAGRDAGGAAADSGSAQSPAVDARPA